MFNGQNDPVVKDCSLAWTKNIGSSQNGPMVKECSLGCTKNIEPKWSSGEGVQFSLH